ncbi:MAG: heme-binding protein [Solirubrobacteraceae bacterium]
MTAFSDTPDQPADPARGSDMAAAGAGEAATPPGPVMEVRPATTPSPLKAAVSMPSDFRFDEVRAAHISLPPVNPPLGPLAAFHGNFHGSGFNTIFRPDNTVTPTPLPVPVGTTDNILELNLTQETLSFSAALGSVPNRGSVQGDAFLNGVPYLQAINDVTTGHSIGIHFEPGLWVIVPPTKDPQEGSTLARMASIPHGTTINAQGNFRTVAGPPVIAKVDITPFVEGSPATKIHFASQAAAAHGTPRIPQDLASFINAGTITQAILDDPNSVLRNAIAGQHITETTVIQISTSPSSPLFGGGTDNIAFLWGNPAAVTSPHPTGQNAQAVEMTAVFWIETVQHKIVVPSFKVGQHPLILKPQATAPRQTLPTFNVRPPFAITHPRTITVPATQIQYTQTVNLNFAGLTWPHVSVATLVPAAPLSVPPSVWTAP